MLSRPRPRPRPRAEPTIALINVVFLMLTFFLIAGTLAPQIDPRLTLPRASDLAAAPPPDGFLVLSDGTTLMNGRPASVEDAVAAGPRVRVVPDRDLPAADLVRLSRALRGAGAEEIVLVTERALE
jgi:biopolymer transport protein ExbD